jgi:hypothetical protein
MMLNCSSFVLHLPVEQMGIYTVFIVQAYETSQHVVPRGGIFLSK